DDDRGGDVDVVEDVADVVKHAGGYFGHAGDARGAHKVLVDGIEFPLSFLHRRDVAPNADEADDFASAVAHGEFGGDHPTLFAVLEGDIFLAPENGLAFFEDGLVVGGVLLGQFAREEIVVGFAEHIGFAFASDVPDVARI